MLGKRARTHSDASPLVVVAAKQAPPAKRLCTDQTSNPDKKSLPLATLATQGDTPKTPTKKPSPGQQHFSQTRLPLAHARHLL